MNIQNVKTTFKLSITIEKNIVKTHPHFLSYVNKVLIVEFTKNPTYIF